MSIKLTIRKPGKIGLETKIPPRGGVAEPIELSVVNTNEPPDVLATQTVSEEINTIVLEPVTLSVRNSLNEIIKQELVPVGDLETLIDDISVEIEDQEEDSIGTQVLVVKNQKIVVARDRVDIQTNTTKVADVKSGDAPLNIEVVDSDDEATGTFSTGKHRIADATYANSDNSFTGNLKPGEHLPIPDVDIDFNGNKVGEIVSAKEVEFDLVDGNSALVTPTSVTLTGNKLTVEVASGGGSLVDRFGNPLPTGAENAQEFNFADEFLSKRADWSTALYTDGEARAAIQWLVNELILEDIWKEYYLFFPVIGATMDERKYNLRYPFANKYGFELVQSGSVNQADEGFEFIGSGVVYVEGFSEKLIADVNNWSCGMYFHTSNLPASGNQMAVNFSRTTGFNTGILQMTIGNTSPQNPFIGLKHNGVNVPAPSSFLRFNDLQRTEVSGTHARSWFIDGSVHNAATVSNVARDFGTLGWGGQQSVNTDGTSGGFTNPLDDNILSCLTFRNAISDAKRATEAAIIHTFNTMLNRSV